MTPSPKSTVHGSTAWPRLGIVILNWRRPVEVLETLAYVAALNYPSVEVVVVDNGSMNGSVESIRAGFPNVSLIENGSNLGFAAGNNVGIDYLRTRDVEYVFLLNDDTSVPPDLLSRLVETAQRDPRIGMVGPTIYYFEPDDSVWSAGGSVNALGQPSHLAPDALTGGSAGPRDVDYVSGCGILVRRSVLDRIGALDDRFFAYFEETEWCARARRAGFRVVHDPSATMWHKIPSADRSESPTYMYLMTRNRLLYLRCTGASRLTRLRAGIEMLRGLGRALLNGQRPVYPRAVLTALLHAAIGRFGVPPTHLSSARS